MDTCVVDKVISRLWCLDEEYERLKSEIADDKIMLAALKQQVDLLIQISKQGNQEEQNSWEIEYDPKLAAQELRDLFRKIEPLLVN